MKILIVDDDLDILKTLKLIFELYGFEVLTASSWAEGEKLLESVDLLILDVMLPDADGFEILRKLRQKKPAFPIIMLTAKDKLSDKVLGLESGADDYVVKPFETLELIARVKACLRRAQKCSQESLTVGDLYIDFKQRIVKKKEQEIYLTPKEFAILCFLCSKIGEVVSKHELKKALWDEADIYAWSRTIDVHIMHLRKKIEDDPSNPKYILTVPSVGYKFCG
ncbi:response regulator transcription factor [Thermodesulfovibrio hydrogeniphilus]